MKHIRHLLLLLTLLTAGFTAEAQLYGNEWIDYSKTYYKFKVGKEGIYRIAASALAGPFASVPGAQFKLYRDGQEVPLFVTTNAAFGANDYIEFYGRKADGFLDKELYGPQSQHPDDRINMFADTAAYFLTYDNTTVPLRYAQTANNIPATPPPALSYNIATVGTYFLNDFTEGRNHVPGTHVPASIFDYGEGYIDYMVDVNTPLNYTLNTPHAVSAPVNALINFSVIRSSYNYSAIPIKAILNGQQIADSTIDRDETKHFNLSVPSSLLGNTNTLQISAVDLQPVYDQYGLSYYEAQYPRDYDMGGVTFYSFKLPASSSSQYLEFTSFNSGSSAPRLYDLTARKWYIGDMSVAGKVRFYVDPYFAERKFVLYSEVSNSIQTISPAKQINFTNYSNAANQGNYILVTHKNYGAITNGHNYIDDYETYRSSVAGGSYQVVIAEVNELYDQFAYGNDIHPLSIRHFLKYAYDKWTPKPHDVFLVGKGLLYHKYRTYQQNPGSYPYAGIVPTYGDLGSDNNFVNFGPNALQQINVGRLSAWNPQEISNYLEKIKSFEAALTPAPLPTHQTELWKKEVLHIGGGRYVSEQAALLATLNNSAVIIKDTAYGAHVTTIAKNSSDPIDQVNNKNIDSLVNNGLSLITFHGHATSNGFELNLNNPETYNSAPKLPHFLALGCDVSQIFNLSSATRTLSERYLIAPTGGSISMIASNNLQYPNFHASYLPAFYKSVSQRNYGGSIGDHHQFAYDSLRSVDNTAFTYFHLESMLLQGDPATRVFGVPKPDYHIASNRLSSIPGNVVSTLDSFTLKIIGFNLGRAVKGDVDVKVEHINPGGVTTLIKTLNFTDLFNTDTAFVRVPVNALADIGLNKYRVSIDDNDVYDENNESNNVGVLDLFIYSDNLVPIYPYEFSIVNKQGITLKASTLNPFRGMGRYKIEIDTTELFNSNLKQHITITSAGGVIKWTPNMVYVDSTVYYWRTAFDSTVNGTYQWSYSSFIYLANGSPGWNQSHYYQYQKNSFTNLAYGTDRTFKYPVGYNSVTASNAIYSDQIAGWPWNTADFVKVMFNGIDIQRLGCQPWQGTIQVTVFDSVTNALWKNDPINGTSGAYPSCLSNRNVYTFEFPVNTPQGRSNAAHFLDSIPNGHFVLVRNIINLGAYDTAFVDEWKTDVSPTPTLYQVMNNYGFNQIDSFNQIRPFIFFRKKGDNSYPVYQYFGQTMLDTLVKEFVLPTLRTSGNMNSTVIGPALQWQQMKWKYSALDNQLQNDHPYVTVIGVDTNNISAQLYQGYALDTSLSFISAVQYPKLKLIWTSLDSMNLTSPQLNSWRVLYSPVPEAALNPAAYFAFKDSLQTGQLFDFAVAIENLTDIPMDSMLVNYKIIDANSSTHLIASKRYRPLPGNDTLHATLSFDASSYAGDNVFFIEANPDNDQPEQYHPNNLGYVPFKMIKDEKNPLIDVTFDGVHILDKDIVSSKPFIKITLKDENKYLALDDTSLLTVRLRYPDQISTSTVIPFDGTICKFIPAQPASGKNEATIEFRPTFLEDGIYELFVNGRDKSGNEAGKTDYQVAFEVINKSSISNILNYPNPFSTSTAFVFTLTGSEIPSQFKIQILSVTGKVVREITRQELGPIHIGRNITEYKWDGKDQYGQMLGNGVYLYRVITSIKGNEIEHRQSGADKFYKNGYGKMYIMR
jgi:hypothetical protein